MADAFHRTPGDQTTYGYRQLPGSGPTRGPELKTMVYATFGVALGIVVGTLIADGSLSATNLFASHQPVRAGSSTANVAHAPAAKPAQAPLLTAAQANSQSAGGQKSAPGKTSTIAQSPLQTAVPASAKTTVPAQVASVANVASVPRASTAIAQAAPLSKSSSVAPATGRKAPVLTKASTAQKVSAGHRHRLLHRLVGRGRHFGKRKGHLRYRAYPLLKETVIQKPSPRDESPKFVAAVAEPFVFFVEGNVTVANFDSTAGTIDTYEGETFAVDRTVAPVNTVSWLDYPPDIHYRCDQSWNCTLIHDGRVVLNVKRTR